MAGVLHVNIVEDSFDMEQFNNFIEELLDVMTPWTPDHPPNSVIVLDNCKIHKDPAMARMVEARYVYYVILLYLLTDICRGMKIIFLPPYSPKFNPIELAFSLLKSWFRSNYEQVLEAWGDLENPDHAPELILSLIDRVDTERIRGWFEHCGYDVFFD